MNQLKLYLQYIGIYLKTKMEYRVSFFIELFANVVMLLVHVMGIWIIFKNFKLINNWNYFEVIFLFSLSWISYGISGLFFWAPMMTLGEMVQSGEFDSILIRPMSPLVHLVFRQFQHTFFARILLAIVLMIYSLNHLVIEWNFVKMLWLIISILCGVVLNSGLLIFTGALSFWVINNREIVWLFCSQGGSFRGVVDYPISIYNKFIKILLTFIIPYAFINFYPSIYFLSKNSSYLFHPVLRFLTPIVSLFVFLCSYHVWRRGIKHYNSTGS